MELPCSYNIKIAGTGCCIFDKLREKEDNCVSVEASRGLAPYGAGWHVRTNHGRCTSQSIDFIGLGIN